MTEQLLVEVNAHLGIKERATIMVQDGQCSKLSRSDLLTDFKISITVQLYRVYCTYLTTFFCVVAMCESGYRG